MTTTSKFQHYPDFFNSIEECENFKLLPKIQTNERYKNFYQTHFTAGDEEQFDEYKSSKIITNNCSIPNNIVDDIDIWNKYKEIDYSSVSNTFRYLFYKFKKGIFIKISNNNLDVFLPFSNSNFINEWSHLIDSTDCNKIFEYVCNTESRNFNPKSVNFNTSSWYSNNYLIRYEYPIKEGDTNVCVIKNMFEELCKEKAIPDIEFFVNRRDFPLHQVDGYEPYFDIWNDMFKPLVSHNYEKYSPLLSMCKNKNFADILIPTHEDWTRVQAEENKYFPHSLRSLIDKSKINLDWKSKISTCVFRGSSTGKGITIETNARLKAAFLSSQKLRDSNDNLLFLDAGITKWNARPKKIASHKKLQTINIQSLPFGLVSRISLEEQSNYKYILHIDGHVTAFRLSAELSLFSVLLIVESEWNIWYSHLLKPYIHYIPVKNDLSDLIDQIKWCKLNDEKCEEIAKNALEFYNKYLSKDAILTNLQHTIINLKKHIGDYHNFEISYKNILLSEELNLINIFLKNQKKYRIKNELSDIPKRRSSGVLNCISYIISSHRKNLLKSIDDKTDECIIYKNKSTNIYKLSYQNKFDFSLKIINEKKMNENIHEAFVGLFCINNVLKYIPNFCFTYGIFKRNNFVREYIDNSISFFDYIKSEHFNFKEYLFILIQIASSIQVSQNLFNFVHYDLTTWNILLQKQEKPLEIDYLIDEKTCITIKTSFLPIIIDYGKSYFIHKHQHHGFVKLFKFSKSQDVLSLLVNSLFQILTYQHLEKSDFSKLIKMANIFSGTPFRKNTFETFKDMKLFFSNQKKYSLLIEHNDSEFGSLSPKYLIQYILNTFKSDNFDILYKNTDSYIPYMITIDDDLMYRIMSNKKAGNTYFIKRIKNIIDNVKEHDEKIVKLNTILTNFKVFLKNDTKKLIRNLRKLSIKKKIIKKDTTYISKYDSISIHYNENDFFSIDKISNIQKQIKKIKVDFFSKPEKINDLIQKRYDETNICDFENIIQKLCQSNTHFKQKLTKL